MTKRLLGLSAILIAATFLFSQAGATAPGALEPAVGACFMMPDIPETSDCSGIQGQTSCSTTCIPSHVGESVIPEWPLPSSSPGPDTYSFHAGRLLSGPEPFPPKLSAVS